MPAKDPLLRNTNRVVHQRAALYRKAEADALRQIRRAGRADARSGVIDAGVSLRRSERAGITHGESGARAYDSGWRAGAKQRRPWVMQSSTRKSGSGSWDESLHPRDNEGKFENK